ncbi:Uncharacterised protein [Burkholderia pseudomallei]|nr:Uncharacterised protein [Burkholderia pseudomallei]
MGAIVAGPGTRYRSRRAKNRRVGRRAKTGAGGGPRSRARRQFAAARVAGSDRLRSAPIADSDRRVRSRVPAAGAPFAATRQRPHPRFAPSFRPFSGCRGRRPRTHRPRGERHVGGLAVRHADDRAFATARRETSRLRARPRHAGAPARRRAGALATAPRRAPNTSAVRPTAKKPRGLRDNTAFPRFSRFRPLAPRRSPRAPPPSRAASPPGRSRLTVRTS